MRIKHSDIKTKSKVILDVVWRHLSGNDLPYLSVSIYEVKLNRQKINSWSVKGAQLKAIKKISDDLYNLASLHGFHSNGESIHMVSNMQYYYKLLKQHHYEKPKTKEDLNKSREESRKLFYSLLQDLTKMTNLSYQNVKEEISKRIKEFNSFDKYLNHLDENKKMIYAKSYTECKDKLLAVFEQYKLLKNCSNYGLMSESEVWTIQRFCNYSGMTEDQVKDLFFVPDANAVIESYCEEKVKENKKLLDYLTNKYNIETVTD